MFFWTRLQQIEVRHCECQVGGSEAGRDLMDESNNPLLPGFGLGQREAVIACNYRFIIALVSYDRICQHETPTSTEKYTCPQTYQWKNTHLLDNSLKTKTLFPSSNKAFKVPLFILSSVDDIFSFLIWEKIFYYQTFLNLN